MGWWGNVSDRGLEGSCSARPSGETVGPAGELGSEGVNIVGLANRGRFLPDRSPVVRGRTSSDKLLLLHEACQSPRGTRAVHCKAIFNIDLSIIRKFYLGHAKWVLCKKGKPFCKNGL